MDREAFEARIEAQRPRLYRTARRMLPADDCEDAVQSAILAAWEHLPQLRSETAFDAWLMRILMNQCRQIQRNRQKQKNLIHALSREKDTQTQAEADLQEALERLRADEKELLLRHHEQGYSLSELSGMYGQSEDVLKMRLYRARKRLRIALISLLLLLLLASAAIGMGLLDVQWFLANRRAEPAAQAHSDFGSESSISYSGRYLAAEISDVQWNMEQLEVMIAYSIAGTDADALTVHSANIGVDGKRHDHIWIDGDILPVTRWADGKPVYTYTLDGWTIDGHVLSSSEDSLPDGKGEAQLSVLHLDQIDPRTYLQLLTSDGALRLTSRTSVKALDSGNTVEEGNLTVIIAAPDKDTWRAAYEAFYR